MIEKKFKLKREVILTHAKTWVSLEYIMLSEMSQLQKNEYCMIPPICPPAVSSLKQKAEWLAGSGARWEWEVGVQWVQSVSFAG